MAGEPGPEEAVSGLDSGSVRRTGEDEKLVAEGEVLQHEFTPDAQDITRCGAEEQEIGDQGRASFLRWVPSDCLER